MKRIAIFLMLTCIASCAEAHFPWLVIENGKAAYFFGEELTDRTYKLPPTIAKANVMARVNGKLKPLATEVVESDTFVGKMSAESAPAGADLVSQATFGVYHGAKLTYYTQHLGGAMPKSFSECKPFEKMALQAHAVDTKGGVDVYVLWNGKPLKDAEVKLYCAEGHEEGEGKTDASGKVSFNDKQVEDGVNGIVVGYTNSKENGKFGDQEYKSAMHYLTATFQDPEGE